MEERIEILERQVMELRAFRSAIRVVMFLIEVAVFFLLGMASKQWF